MVGIRLFPFWMAYFQVLLLLVLGIVSTGEWARRYQLVKPSINRYDKSRLSRSTQGRLEERRGSYSRVVHCLLLSTEKNCLWDPDWSRRVYLIYLTDLLVLDFFKVIFFCRFYHSKSPPNHYLGNMFFFLQELSTVAKPKWIFLLRKFDASIKRVESLDWRIFAKHVTNTFLESSEKKAAAKNHS